MVLSNAENKREWRERNNALAAVGRAHLAGRPRDVFVRAHIVLRKLWPRHRSRKACILWVTNQGRGGVQEYSTAQKSYAVASEKMLKIPYF